MDESRSVNEPIHEDHGRAAYGNRRTILRCPSCGTEVRLLDRKFVRFGPVRCGGCGTDLRSTARRAEVRIASRGRSS